MRIRYADGRTLDGMVLSLKGSVARVAIKDEDDAAEFNLVHGQWISEDCETVTFDFPLAIFRSIEDRPAETVGVLLNESAVSNLCN
jgi:hypothetical protein